MIMSYGNLTPISIAATVQSYTASKRMFLKQPFCANTNAAPTLLNVHVQQINQAPATQTATGTTVSFWFAVTGTLSYVPVGCNQEIQVPFRFILPPVSFTGTSGQTPTVAPSVGTAQIINSVVSNSCVNAVCVAVPVTFTATYPS